MPLPTMNRMAGYLLTTKPKFGWGAWLNFSAEATETLKDLVALAPKRGPMRCALCFVGPASGTTLSFHELARRMQQQ